MRWARSHFTANSPGEGVAEGGEVADVVVLADEAGEGGEQRGEEEAGDPAVQPVGDPRVVALHEVVVHGGVEGGQDQAGQHLPAVAQHVGVVEGHVLGALLGEDVAHGQPAGAALARLAHVEAARAQVVEQLLDGGLLVPQDHLAPRVAGEVVLAAPVVGGGGLVQGDHEGVEVRDLRRARRGCRAGQGGPSPTGSWAGRGPPGSAGPGRGCAPRAPRWVAPRGAEGRSRVRSGGNRS